MDITVHVEITNGELRLSLLLDGDVRQTFDFGNLSELYPQICKVYSKMVLEMLLDYKERNYRG